MALLPALCSRIGTAQTLAELEAIVATGQETFMAVGRALLEIQSAQLYIEAGYRTFGDYLASRWPRLSRRHAYDTIAAASVEADGIAGFGPSHLVELARLPDPRERRHMADLAAARNLTVRELRALIRERQQAEPPRRPLVIPDLGPPSASIPAAWSSIVAGDARRLELEDGDGHLDRVRGGPCEASACRHPFLVLTSPPYNAGLTYDADPTGDSLPWRQYWHELVVPHFREVLRVLAPGGRFACNLANVLRSDIGDRRRGDGFGARSHRPGDYVIRDNKRQHAGANGASWAVMVDRLIWATWRRLGLLERERITWIKTVTDTDDEGDRDPENTITMSTAWGTYCSPENPVLRAVAEPIFVASKASHGRERPEGAVSDLDPASFKALTRNAWFIPSNVDRGRHPAPWPLELPARLIRLYTWPGDLVVDPFVGTGAAAEAAVLSGRRFYGTDRSPVYVNDAARRVAEAYEATLQRLANAAPRRAEA